MKSTLGLILLLAAFTSLSGCTDKETEIKKAIQAEAELQKKNVSIYDEGVKYPFNIMQVKVVETREQADQLNEAFTQMTNVEDASIRMIYSLDEFKLLLLKKNNVNHKIQFEYSICPRKLNLKKFKNLSDEGIAAKNLINADGKTPSKKGLELFYQLNEYRNKLIKIVGKGDQKILDDLNKLLSFPKEVNGRHWVVNSFDDTNLIESVTTLTLLQNKILSARVLALAYLNSKIGSYKI